MILKLLPLLFSASIGQAQTGNQPQVLPPKTDSAAALEASKAAATAEATLDIEWEKIEDATSYEVKLTPATGGVPLKFNTTDTRLVTKLPLGSYKFRIRSRDKANGYFGPWSAETEVEVATKSVQLLNPPEGAEISEPKEKRHQVEFEWTPVLGAKEYTLRIWFDDEKNAREFKSKTTKKVLSLPSAKAYAWQVTFLTDQSVGYLAAPQIGNFKVLGKQLIKPLITEKVFQVEEPKQELKEAKLDSTKQKIKWKQSPNAKTYKVKLGAKGLDEEEYQALQEISRQELAELSFDKLKPGAYKIEVIAQAPNRVSSEPAIYEFVIKPSEAELARAMKKAVQYQ